MIITKLLEFLVGVQANDSFQVTVWVSYLNYNKELHTKKALLGFEPRISCLLDRRFSH